MGGPAARPADTGRVHGVILRAYTPGLGSAGAVKNIIIAWIVAGPWSTGINPVGQDIAWARVYGKLQMYIASPAAPHVYLLGLLASHFAVHMPVSIAVLSLISDALDALGLIPAAVAAGLLVLPCSVFLGLALAMRIRKHTNISAITNPISIILIRLPPVFYPPRGATSTAPASSTPSAHSSGGAGTGARRLLRRLPAAASSPGSCCVEHSGPSASVEDDKVGPRVERRTIEDGVPSHWAKRGKV